MIEADAIVRKGTINKVIDSINEEKKGSTGLPPLHTDTHQQRANK